MDVGISDVRIVQFFGSLNLFVCHHWRFASEFEGWIVVFIIIITSISYHAGQMFEHVFG